MREIALWDAEPGIDATFGDVEDLARACRFRDCTHGSEPGCAVRQAREEGSLDPARWDSYDKLRREARFTARKHDALLQREETSRWKRIHRAMRRNRKG
jgi:ribosome biogenesis GTPase